jgi:hypothetical protein
MQAQVWTPLHPPLTVRTPEDPAYARTYAWLAQHTTQDEGVAYNRNRDFMAWVYADYGVNTLLGLVPHTQPGSEADYEQRKQTFYWLVDAHPVNPAGCLVRYYHVEYVVTSSDKIPGDWPNYYNARISHSPRLEVVHRDGPLTVYGVTAAGRACSTADG